MLTIKILGPDSPYTDKLESYARAALKMLNPHAGYEIVRINDEAAIGQYAEKVPALVINEALVAEGTVPAPQLIVTWASDALQTALVQGAYQAEALAPAAR